MGKRSLTVLIVLLVAAALGATIVMAARGAGTTREMASGNSTGSASRKQLWHCGMHPQVIREEPGECPICHMPLTPMKSTESGSGAAAGEHLWWDPMLGPSSISDHPGKSAMGMDMVPYTPQGGGGPEVIIDPAVVQDMGVQTAPVTRGPLHRTIRAVGLFKLPDPGLHDISLKVGGWIDTLYADQEGMHVNKGEPLFGLYSPELQVAGQELISAVQSQRSLGPDASPSLRNESQGLIDSARRKLELWDLDEQEIDAIAKADRPPRDVIFHSPATGHIEDKMVVQGSAVQPGMKLMRVADHTKMWLDAEVYEEQIPMVQMGQTVEATLDAIPGRLFTGKVSFIYPHVEHMTRTLTVRAAFDNPNFQLKPGMYADANVVTEPVPDAIQVPQEAMIDTGTKQIVFVAAGNGHFSPRSVRAGVRGDDDRLQIAQGLAVGETVVTSGQFLMDVESRTNEAIAKLRGGSEPAPTAQPMAGMKGTNANRDDSAAQPTTAEQTAALTSTQPMPPMAGMAGMSPDQAGSTTEPASRPARLSQVYCPMAKAQWLQLAGEVENPYMGPEMKGCGEVKSELAAPPASSPLSPVVAAYLSAQRSMAAGRHDAATGRQLKMATDPLKTDEYAGLRAAVDKFAAATDLNSARTQFKAISDALAAALKPSSDR
jgi:Cu(I)/Ag(I) efflux system membrane fusion protein/cobalt-zinc-cadmium efflux system membrane fusion protein